MKRLVLIIGLMVTIVGLGAAPAQAGPVAGQADAGQAAAAAQHTPSVRIPDQSGVRLVNVRYGECLDQVGGGNTEDTPIGHYPCGSADNRQQWDVIFIRTQAICVAADSDGRCFAWVNKDLYQVRSLQSGMCVHPERGNINSGTIIVQRYCLFDSLRDMYYLDPGPHGGYYFHGAKVFADTLGSHVRGIDAPPFSQDYRVRLWTHDGGGTAENTAQEWLIQP